MYLFKYLLVGLYLLIGLSSIIVMDYPRNQTRNTIGTSIFSPDLKQNYQTKESQDAFKNLMWNRWMDENEKCNNLNFEIPYQNVIITK